MSLALQEVPLVIHDVFHEHCYLTLRINVSIMEVLVTCISLENKPNCCTAKLPYKYWTRKSLQAHLF